MPADRDILFLPDMFLGAYLERVTGRRDEDLAGRVPRARRHPHRRRLRGCWTSAGRRPADPPRVRLRQPVHVRWPRRTQRCRTAHQGALDRGHGATTPPRSPKRDFVVATETGILHRLTKESPDKRFYAMSERAVCRYMKMITLEKLRDSLRDMQSRRHGRRRRRRPRPRRDHAHGRDRLSRPQHVLFLVPTELESGLLFPDGPPAPLAVCGFGLAAAGAGAAHAIAEHRAAAEGGVVLAGQPGPTTPPGTRSGRRSWPVRCAATASARAGGTPPSSGSPVAT